MSIPDFPVLSRAGLALVSVLLSPLASADWTDARCDIYPAGQDQASAVVPCVFSQRQGSITITRSDGVIHDLVPTGDNPGNYRDEKGRDVYRQSGLGKDGLIFRFPDESVYVYWDTAGLPGTDSADNYTAPYTTAKFDATARISCSLSGHEMKEGSDCAAGVNRGPGPGQAVVAIMRPDGVERVLQFDGKKVVSPGEGNVQARFLEKPGEWDVSIDNRENYRIPVELLTGG